MKSSARFRACSMRRRWPAFMLWVLMPLLAAGGGNPVVNGYFRQPSSPSDPAPGWTMNRNVRHQDVRIEPGAGRNGTPALAIRPLTPTRNPGILSQSVPVAPGRAYTVLIWARMDVPVLGTTFRVRSGCGRVSNAVLWRDDTGWRDSGWRLFALSFELPTDSGERAVEILISRANRSDRRYTIGSTLYVDSVELVETGAEHNIALSGDGSARLEGRAVIEPGFYYLWARVRQQGMTAYRFEAGDVLRSFRGYTAGETYWLRPVLRELYLEGGPARVRLAADDAGARIEELILTRDPFWTPEGADAFREPAEAVRQIEERGFEPAKRRTVALRALGGSGEGARPVTQGLPFPRGELASPGQVRWTDGRPLQAEVWARWPDGSAKWLLLSTVARPGEELELEYGTEVRCPPWDSPLRVVETPAGVTVDTGAVRFEVPADGSALLRNVTAGISRLGMVYSVVDGRYDSRQSRPEVTVEEAGPLRAVVRVRGEYRDEAGEKRLGYLFRVMAHAGRTTLELEPVFILEEDVLSYTLREVSLRLVRATEKVTVHAGDTSRMLETDAGAIEWVAGVRGGDGERNLYPYEVRQGDALIERGFEARGLLMADGPDGPLALEIEDFWQNAPKALRVSDGEIRVSLLDGPLTFYHGMSKSHRLLLDLNGDENAVAETLDRVILLAGPDWYGKTMALQQRFSTADEVRYPAAEAALHAGLEREIERQTNDLYVPGWGGLIHFGDRIYARGPPPHGLNLETAVAEGTMVQLFRTGDVRYLGFLDRAVRHFLDIDIDHSDRSGGAIYTHSPHERSELERPPRLCGHSWFNGTHYYGLFTGWRRVLDTAPRVGAHYAAQRVEARTLLHYWRMLAWKFMSVMSAYETTGDTALLEAALEDVRVTAAQRDFLAGRSDYMASVGLKALRQYYACTEDPAVRELFLQVLDGMLPEALRERTPDPDAAGREAEPVSARGLAVLNELSWGTRWTGDERYVRHGAARFNRALAFSGAGVDATAVWGAADLLAAMARLGIPGPETSADGPGPWLHPPIDITMAPQPGLPDPDQPTLVFLVERISAGPLRLVLYQVETGLQPVPFRWRVFDGAGETVHDQRLLADRYREFALELPAGEPGEVFTLAVQLEDYYRLTTQPAALDLTGRADELRRLAGDRPYPVLEADPGRVTLEIRAVRGRGRARLDRLYLAPWDFTPFTGDPWPEETIMISLADLELPPGWSVIPDRHAGGGRAVTYYGESSRGSADHPLRFTAEVPAGRYRIFIRCWQSLSENLSLRIPGGPAQRMGLGVFHPDRQRLAPRWNLKASPPERALVRSGDAVVDKIDPRVKKILFGDGPPVPEYRAGGE